MPGVYQPPIKRGKRVTNGARWTMLAIVGVVAALLVVASHSEPLFVLFVDLSFVVLASLGWVWFEDRRATAPDRRRRRALASAFPTARTIRVRVEAWRDERLDINPALGRVDRKPPPLRASGR